jgi:hypothetical protein
MGSKVSRPVCQYTSPINVKDGTNPLSCSPAPGPARGPGDVSDEIGASYMPVHSAFCIDGAEMQVLAVLRSQQSTIVAAEQKFRVDRLAIAGAIAWEMLKNAPDWKRRALRTVAPVPRSVGWGKVHLYNFSGTGAVVGSLAAGPLGGLAGAFNFDTIAKETEEAGYLPELSFAYRRKVLSTPEGAITYVAAIMAAIADLAAEYGFDDIRSEPSILTNVYQGDTLSSWEEKLKKKPAGAPFLPGNDMALWVIQNIPFLEDAVGAPDLPESAAAPCPPSNPAKQPAAKKADSNSNKLDKDKLVKWMDDHAESGSVHLCATYVRKGLEAGGLNTDLRPNLAKDYGPFLLKIGFVAVPEVGYTPQAGDLVVFEGTDKHTAGHVQVYDGKQWVSDFKQNSYNPYYDDTKSQAYRFP